MTFIDARLTKGVHDYIIGSLPFTYKMLGMLAGFHGNRESGIRTRQEVAAKGRLNRYDAQVFLTVLYRREHTPAKAIPIFDGLIARFPRNYLFRIELAQMYAASEEKRQALAVLQKVEDLKKAGASGYGSLPEEKIAYYKGALLFRYNDLNPALAQMKQVAAKSSELDLNTGMQAWMRVGQIYDLKGQCAEAVNAYKQAIALAPESDGAKEPRQYLSSPYRRKEPA